MDGNQDLSVASPKFEEEVIPIRNMADVAKIMDQESAQNYSYFLIRMNDAGIGSSGTSSSGASSSGISTASNAVVTPPPFKKPTADIIQELPRVDAAPMESDDLPYLAENAAILMRSGEVNLARNIYRAILKTGEMCEVAYAGLAECADHEGFVEQAIQFAWDSVAFAPNRKGYQLLAQLLVQQGKDRDAAAALNRAIKTLDLSIQEKSEYLKMIGNCFSRLGENVEAERAYKRALELSPASDEVQSNLGSLYLEQGQNADAKRCYQDAIASNPTNDKAWVGLGLCYVNEGEKELAHDAFARSLERNIRNSTAIFHLVKCAYEIKRYGIAEKVLANYVGIAPVSPSLLYSLAGLQFHVGKKREAEITAKRILQIKADHQGARDLITRIESEQTQVG